MNVHGAGFAMNSRFRWRSGVEYGLSMSRARITTDRDKGETNESSQFIGRADVDDAVAILCAAVFMKHKGVIKGERGRSFSICAQAFEPRLIYLLL